MRHIYRAIDNSQQDEDYFPQPQATLINDTDLNSLQNSKSKDLNAFGEILDNFEKHCSTSNIQVRNGGV